MSDKQKKIKVERETAAFQMLKEHIARQEWDELQTKIEEIKLVLASLPQATRQEILNTWCRGCGGANERALA